jgi:hypothetical protein
LEQCATARIPEGILGMALDRVIPVADIHCATGTIAKVDGDEGKIG